MLSLLNYYRPPPKKLNAISGSSYLYPCPPQSAVTVLVTTLVIVLALAVTTAVRPGTVTVLSWPPRVVTCVLVIILVMVPAARDTV